ncbi:MAG: hypothetical protein ACP5SD_10520 [Elusimicrobiales bacterium]
MENEKIKEILRTEDCNKIIEIYNKSSEIEKIEIQNFLLSCLNEFNYNKFDIGKTVYILLKLNIKTDFLYGTISRLIKSTDSQLRYGVTNAIIKSGDTDLSIYLFKKIFPNERLAVKRSILYIISNIKYIENYKKDILDNLIKLLEDKDDFIKIFSAIAIARFRIQGLEERLFNIMAMNLHSRNNSMPYQALEGMIELSRYYEKAMNTAIDFINSNDIRLPNSNSIERIIEYIKSSEESIGVLINYLKKTKNSSIKQIILQKMSDLETIIYNNELYNFLYNKKDKENKEYIIKILSKMNNDIIDTKKILETKDEDLFYLELNLLKSKDFKSDDAQNKIIKDVLPLILQENKVNFDTISFIEKIITEIPEEKLKDNIEKINNFLFQVLRDNTIELKIRIYAIECLTKTNHFIKQEIEILNILKNILNNTSDIPPDTKQKYTELIEKKSKNTKDVIIGMISEIKIKILEEELNRLRIKRFDI